MSLADDHVARGNELYRAGQVDDAMASYLDALACDSMHAKGHYCLGVVLQEIGRYAQARGHYESVLAAAPHDEVARANLAIVKLMQGDFATGWDDYELRLASGGVKLRPSPLPRLDPGDLGSARRLAVRREQGIGDQVLFSTLLPELLARGVDAVVETDVRLLAAYRRSFPQIAFVSKVEAPAAFEACDRQIPVGSLAGLFRRSRAAFSRQPPRILHADSARRAAMARHFRSGPHIAISWRTFQGAGRGHIERRRTIPLEEFARLDATLVDLQYGDVAQERTAFDVRHPAVRLDIPSLDRFEDLEGVMAAIDLCDLVITSSNITAHLAGALGKRTWLVYLGAIAPFHYWVPGPEGRSLWYPSVEIMTDKSWTTWAQAFEAVTERWRRDN